MPKTNDADLDNDYGSIFLSDLSGTANINCDYGKISIGELSAENNSINLDYCSASNVVFMKSGNLDLDYSKITIENSGTLKVNADYSALKFEKIEDIDFNADYGSITIDEALNVNGNSDYVSMRFGTIRKNLKIDTDYGAISVKRLVKDFESVNIDGEYAGIRINVDQDAVFNFELNLQYASFKRNEDNIEFYKKISKSSKKYYEIKIEKENDKKFQLYDDYLEKKITKKDYDLYTKRYDDLIIQHSQRIGEIDQFAKRKNRYSCPTYEGLR